MYLDTKRVSLPRDRLQILIPSCTPLFTPSSVAWPGEWAHSVAQDSLLWKHLSNPLYKSLQCRKTIQHHSTSFNPAEPCRFCVEWELATKQTKVFSKAWPVYLHAPTSLCVVICLAMCRIEIHGLHRKMTALTGSPVSHRVISWHIVSRLVSYRV